MESNGAVHNQRKQHVTRGRKAEQVTIFDVML